MLKQEWKSLFHNKILLLVVIVIALIPAIYAGLFLASMWDPYGNVDKLPVAIVNEDEPAEYGDTTLTVGDQLVDNLKENDSLAFNFVDADVAKEGLKNGTYYMVQGARTNEDVGQVLVFESEDKVNWKFRNRVESEKPFGYMWECPDYFKIGDKKLLSTNGS